MAWLSLLPRRGAWCHRRFDGLGGEGHVAYFGVHGFDDGLGGGRLLQQVRRVGAELRHEVAESDDDDDGG